LWPNNGMDRKEEMEGYRREREEMLALSDQDWSNDRIALKFDISRQAVQKRIKLARKERTQARRAATIRAKQEQAHA
jgi:predicted DNA-binding protein YlxM (UPF0122 family)